LGYYFFKLFLYFLPFFLDFIFSKDERYANEGSDSFDWYFDYDSLLIYLFLFNVQLLSPESSDEILEKFDIDKSKIAILNIGCGNSTFVEVISCYFSLY
jgi:hypothetical protein